MPRLDRAWRWGMVGIVLAVGLQRDLDAVFFVKPLGQIEQLAALATKWPVGYFLTACRADLLLAGWTYVRRHGISRSYYGSMRAGGEAYFFSDLLFEAPESPAASAPPGSPCDDFSFELPPLLSLSSLPFLLSASAAFLYASLR